MTISSLAELNRIVGTVFLAALVLAPVATADEPSVDRFFSSAQHGYRVAFPRQPDVATRPGGEHVYSVLVPLPVTRAYMVSVKAAPRGHGQTPDKQLAAELVRTEKLNLKVRTSRPIQVGTYPGVEYDAVSTGDPAHVFGRFVLVDGRLFHVSSAQAPGEDATEALTFIRSFSPTREQPETRRAGATGSAR
jgi:hypothetical protein